MANTKEIKDKMRTIESTQKITRAMEMVAASKMRKVQEQMKKGRPYSQKIMKVIRHLARGHAEYRHPYLGKRDIKKAGYLIVSTDRGLCGGLNSNLFKLVLEEIQRHQANDVEVELCIIGKKAESFFKRFNLPIIGVKTEIGSKVNITDVIGVVQVMLNRFVAKKSDALFIVYNCFVNTMVQEPMVEQLLPLNPVDEKSYHHHWDYIYEPDARDVLEVLLKRYIEAQVFQAVVENIACEQSARMVAMKSATDNAGDLIKELKLTYNKIRQASITKEIAEIVGGAAAVQ